jgi:hypothetical protein
MQLFKSRIIFSVWTGVGGRKKIHEARDVEREVEEASH